MGFLGREHLVSLQWLKVPSEHFYIYLQGVFIGNVSFILHRQYVHRRLHRADTVLKSKGTFASLACLTLPLRVHRARQQMKKMLLAHLKSSVRGDKPEGKADVFQIASLLCKLPAFSLCRSKCKMGPAVWTDLVFLTSNRNI